MRNSHERMRTSTWRCSFILLSTLFPGPPPALAGPPAASPQAVPPEPKSIDETLKESWSAWQNDQRQRIEHRRDLTRKVGNRVSWRLLDNADLDYRLLRYGEIFPRVANEIVETTVEKEFRDRETAGLYEAAPKHKAVAICLTTYGRIAHASQVDSIASADLAAELALYKCQRQPASSSCFCTSLYRDSDIVFSPPLKEVSEVLRRLLQYEEWGVESDRPGSLFAPSSAALSRHGRVDLPYILPVLDRMADDSTRRAILDIHPIGLPSLPLRMHFEDPDCQLDYYCDCGQPYRYLLLPLAPQEGERIKKEFAARRKAGADYCYKRTLGKMRGSEESLTEQMCRFIARIENASPSRLTPVQTEFPLSLYSSVDYSRVRSLWVEAAARVSSDGVPLQPAEDAVRPILVSTESRDYLVYEMFTGGGQVACYTSHDLKRIAFDLSECELDMHCKSNAVAVLEAKLSSAFAREPLAAEQVVGERALPGELWFRRTRRPSRVLGSPYFEQTTYIVRWWNLSRGGPGGNLLSRIGQLGQPGNAPLDSIYLTVTGATLAAPNINGLYAALTEDQEVRYHDALRRVVQGAIEAACSSLAGSLNQRGTCTVGNQTKQEEGEE